MKLSNLFIVLYLLLSALLFGLFNENILVWASFFLNWLLLTIMLLYHLKIERTFSPFLSSYVTFNFLFFLMAPMIQISAMDGANDIFPNYMPYSESRIIYTNVLISTFHSAFFASYYFFKKKKLAKTTIDSYHISKYLPLNVLIIFIIGCVTLFISYDYLMTLITQSHWRSKNMFTLSVSSQLILEKVLYIMPLGGLVLTHHYLKEKKQVRRSLVYVFYLSIALFLLLIVFKNPLSEKRNAIGPIYITLLFLFSPKLLNSNIKSFVFLFFSLVILFPMASALTHLDASLDQILANPMVIIERYDHGSITKAFNTLHYDAYANVVATVDYTLNHGLSYGYQLISGLLFFVPRSIWTSKSHSSGEFIGDYLIENHGFFFNNLSNPLVSEGYINFGIFGVILIAALLAYFAVMFLGWLKSKNPLKRIMAFYFAVHLIFLLRGDFTNGFAYFIGTLIGVLIIPYLIDLFLKWALRKNNKAIINE